MAVLAYSRPTVKPLTTRSALLFLALALTALTAHAEEGRLVHGTGYEGVILTPAMTEQWSHNAGSIFAKGVWTPSPDLIRQAEAKLPGAIVAQTPPPKIVATYYVPRYFAPKAGTPHASPGKNERLEDNITDSVEQNNFLYDVQANLKDYKRQYIGITVNGRKFLLMSFVHAVLFDDDYVKKEWRHGLVEVLDGGDLLWDVQYDPARGTFSEWNG